MTSWTILVLLVLFVFLLILNFVINYLSQITAQVKESKKCKKFSALALAVKTTGFSDRTEAVIANFTL